MSSSSCPTTDPPTWCYLVGGFRLGRERSRASLVEEPVQWMEASHTIARSGSTAPPPQLCHRTACSRFGVHECLPPQPSGCECQAGVVVPVEP
jgi:hypothetical protein